MFLQTYKETTNWKNGDQLIKAEIVEKVEVHERDLLHLSVHLLIIDRNNRVLARKRKIHDFRYAGLWTSSIGTHVLLEHDYASTLQPLLPIQKEMEYIGEFRVHDHWENEVNGLYVMKANEDELPAVFLEDKTFFTIEELTQFVQQNKTTPHLKGGFALLKQKFFQIVDS